MTAMAPFHWLRVALLRSVWVVCCCCGVSLQAQFSMTALPDDPPASHLYQTSEGNLFFDKYQADQLSAGLQDFAQKHGFAIYLVTVNSPEKNVFIQLRQEIKRKWAARRDCMVIFYDLDTRLLALQFEPVYQDKEGMIVRSVFSYDQEEAWLGFIDRWMKENGQEQGLDLAHGTAFMTDFLRLLETQLGQTREPEKRQGGVYGAAGLLLLLGFVLFLRLRKRVANPVVYLFPKMSVSYRLRAPHGGGVVAVHEFGARKERR